MRIKKLVRRRVFAKPSGYKSEGFGYGGYGGAKKYRPINPGTPIITGKPVTIPFRQQRLSKPNPNNPQGMYVVWVDEDIAEGSIKLRNPLVLPWGAREGKKNWANHLKEKYGVKGRQLTSLLLREKKYDGIITLGGPRLNEKQLDLFYSHELYEKKLKGRPYQIVIFREGRVQFIENPSPENVMERYFSNPPHTDVEMPGASFYSSTLEESVDEDTMSEAIREREWDIEYKEGEIEGWAEEQSDFAQRVGKLQEALELLPDIEYLESDIEDLESDIEDLDEDDLESLEELKTDLAEKRSGLRLLRLEAELLMSEGDISSSFASMILRNFDEDSLAGEIETFQERIDELQWQIDSEESEIERIKEEVSDLENEQYDLENMESGGVGEETLLRLAGVYGLPSSDAYDVQIEYDGNNEYTINVNGPHILNFERTIDLDYMTITNEHLALDSSAPKGLGTRILYSQALAAKAENFNSISCSAARSDHYVGYYTWARLGYSASIDIAVKAYRNSIRDSPYRRNNQGVLGLQDLKKFLKGKSWQELFNMMIEDGLFPKYVTLGTDMDDVEMSDLMMTDKGAAWWKEHGKGWAATFDLNDQPDGEPSRSMQVLSSYVKLKQKARGEEIDKWAAEMNGGPPEIRLTPEDLELLDIAWDMLRKKEVKLWRSGL